ncbi:MAG: type IV pilin [Halorientalis sp.]
MQVKKLITDDSAVSPVIGVILMVAITVLLAATAASFFLGLAGNNTTTPQVAMNFDYTSSNNHHDDRVKITHAGGDTVTADNVVVTVSDANTPSSSVGVISSRFDWNELTDSPTEDITAGTSVNISKYSVGLTSEFGGSKTALRNHRFSLKDASVQVVWNDPDTGKTFTLAQWKSPTAG